jgi:two-component system, cell cycle response regulator DivK
MRTGGAAAGIAVAALTGRTGLRAMWLSPCVPSESHAGRNESCKRVAFGPLVCRHAAPLENMESHTADRRRTPRPQVIVVADDFDSLRHLWRIALSQLGFDVIEAGTGAEAFELTTRYAPAAVVMDLAMPVMDGIEATRRLKRDPRTSDVPIIMVTAHTADKHRRAAEDAGCAGFLSKPTDADELIAELRRVLAGT